jgi:phosphohistidine phosphatase
MTLIDIENSQLENLVIFRHGKAQRPLEADDDFSRNLVQSGKNDALNQSLRLLELGFSPDVALVSSANRALQTFEIIKETFPHAREIITRELYLASPQIYWKFIIESGQKNVLLIAHDPGLHDLCRHFLRGGEETDDALYLAADLPTAGAAFFTRDLKAKNGLRLVKNLRPIKTGI